MLGWMSILIAVEVTGWVQTLIAAHEELHNVLKALVEGHLGCDESHLGVEAYIIRVRV